MSIYRFSFIITLLLSIIGSTVYGVCYYCGIINLAQVFNVIIVFLCLSISMLVITSNPFIISSKIYLLVLISFGTMLISGILQNSFFEIVPTASRYFSYLMIANIAFFNYKNHPNAFLCDLMKFIKIAVYVNIFFLLLEIVLNDIDYLNGAYRIAGPFKKHQLGEALMLYVLNICWFFLFLKNNHSTINILIQFILVAALIATQSRALTVILVGVFSVYCILRIKSIIKLVASLFFIVVLLIGCYYLVINTELMPRYKSMLITDQGINDASTLERIEIMDSSLSNIDSKSNYIGIGLGGFQKFYHNISGRDAVAAHNNYLLFYVEGGYISLVFYLLFQFLYAIKITYWVKHSSNELLGICFCLFWGITVFSFLLNNYYFYCSEIFVWIFIGLSFSIKPNECSILSTK